LNFIQEEFASENNYGTLQVDQHHKTNPEIRATLP